MLCRALAQGPAVASCCLVVLYELAVVALRLAFCCAWVLLVLLGSTGFCALLSVSVAGLAGAAAVGSSSWTLPSWLSALLLLILAGAAARGSAAIVALLRGRVDCRLWLGQTALG